MRHRRSFHVLLAVLGGVAANACGRVLSLDDSRSSSPTDAGVADAGGESASDAGTAADARTCDARAPFGTPLELPWVDGPANPWVGTLTPDELAIYFTLNVGQSSRIFYASRSGSRAAFSEAKEVPGLAEPDIQESTPWISADELTLLFAARRTRGGPYALWRSTRDRPASDFGTPALIFDGDAGSDIISPFLNERSSELFFSWLAGSSYRIHHAFLDGGVGPASEIPLADAGAVHSDFGPVLSKDGLTMYFGSSRDDDPGDIWVTHRPSTYVDWEPPEKVPELGSKGLDAPAFLSADLCRIYLGRFINGIGSLLVAER